MFPAAGRPVIHFDRMVLARLRAVPMYAIVLACLASTACTQLTRAAGLSTPAGNPEPATAILLSIPSDAIYLVDPTTGRAQAIVTDLVDLQAGYATWGPGHKM